MQKCGKGSMMSVTALTSISYSFHFVHIIVVDDVIKCGVKLVEEIHNLVRSAGARELGEAHDITGQKKHKIIYIH